MITQELTVAELDALPIGAIVVPTDRESWPITRAWRKVDPPGPSGPWLRVDESEGMVSTHTSTLAMIGVTLKEIQNA